MRKIPVKRRYLPSPVLGDFLKSLRPVERNDFAELLPANVIYLQQIAIGIRRASPELAKKIEKATNRKVRKKHLRPDIWEN